MKIKVCGMKYPDNLADLCKCQSDFIGFIFYDKSPRFVGDDPTVFSIKISDGSKLVGVFVNSSIEYVLDMVNTFSLDYVQLHGDESLDYVKNLHHSGGKIIKAFQIKADFDWTILNSYSEYVSYFLFDTATENYGGSGKQFDWELLTNYKGATPFFLSGGIASDDISKIKKIDLPQLYAIDVNSRFEIEPGLKNIPLIQSMINTVRHES